MAKKKENKKDEAAVKNADLEKIINIQQKLINEFGSMMNCFNQAF